MSDVLRAQPMLESSWSSVASEDSAGQQVERAHRLALAQLNSRVLDELVPVSALPPKHCGESVRAKAPHVAIKGSRARCPHAEKRFATSHCGDERNAAVRLPRPRWLPLCVLHATGFC